MAELHPGPRARTMRVRGCRYASSKTRLLANLMRTSAPVHSSSSLDVVSTCVRAPESGSVLTETAVRVLLCNGSDLVNVIAASLPAHAGLFNVHKSEVRT